MRLTTLRGDTLSEQLVDLFNYSGELTVRMPKMSSSRPGSGTVLGRASCATRFNPKPSAP